MKPISIITTAAAVLLAAAPLFAQQPVLDQPPPPPTAGVSPHVDILVGPGGAPGGGLDLTAPSPGGSGHPGAPTPGLPGSGGAPARYDVRYVGSPGGEYQWIAASGQAVKAEKVVYLGITSNPVSPELAAHLNLSRGIGMVIYEVAPKSPADEAGLKRYDVLHKLDGQLIINNEQLKTLLQSYKTGSEVTLDIIRKGKPTAIKAKLDVRDEPPHVIFGAPGMGGAMNPGSPYGEGAFDVLIDPNQDPRRFRFVPVPDVKREALPPAEAPRHAPRDPEGLGADKEPRIELKLEKNLLERESDELDLDGLDARRRDLRIRAIEAQRQRLTEELDRLLREMRTAKPDAFDKVESTATATAIYSDEHHTLKLTNRDGDKHLKVTDVKSKKVLFDGPVNTDKQIEKIPADVRKKFEQLRATTRTEVEPGIFDVNVQIKKKIVDEDRRDAPKKVQKYKNAEDASEEPEKSDR